MIKRPDELKKLKSLLTQYPVVGILGPRQVGKTTLAKTFAHIAQKKTHFFDLENSEDLARLSDPLFALKALRGLIVIDEVQLRPDLFPTLRVLADRPRSPARFLILGSASPELLQQGSESLAGRIAYHELSGFFSTEIPSSKVNQLWLRGGFPGSFLAASDARSYDWRRQFIQTFLTRDLPQLGVQVKSATLLRFWNMLAHYHGQTWNASEFARSFGVADTTVRHYLDTLVSALVVKVLSPWYENISKRQVKAPKVFLSDPGIFHALLNVKSMRDLEVHPKMGASWEGFVINQIINILDARPEECFYWAVHAQADVDLLIVRGREKIGFEVKRTSSPQLTASIQRSIKDLGLKKFFLIHAGEETFSLSPVVTAIAFKNIEKELLNRQ